MRLFMIGACLVAVVGSSAAAPAKKKPADKSSKDKAKDKDKDKDKTVDSGEIEMGNDAATTPPVTPTTTPPPTDAAAPAPVAPVTPGVPTLALNDRPLTMPKGKFEIRGGIPITVFSIKDPLGMAPTVSDNTFGLAVGASYGIDDKAEIGLDYALTLSPASAKGPLTIHGAYLVQHSAKLDVAVAAAFAVDPVADPRTTPPTTTTFAALDLGAWLRYRITPKISLFTGVPATPHPGVAQGKLSYALPPLGYQITIGLNNRGPIAINLPVGAGMQVTPNVYGFVELNLANIKLANTTNAFLFADFIPIALGGFYSMKRLDVGAAFSDDLKQPGDYLSFLVMARYFAN